MVNIFKVRPYGYDTMDWSEWIGKRIFVQLKSKAVYSGKVIDLDISSEETTGLIFITILDKFGKRVMFVNSEINKLKEEEE
ncbi:MAG TPA: hypothetical protein VKN74_05220 [Candidatus Mcinerneyibacterium sp.]|nr:hypothetical protein [Candidatus Mcinerneyibacterium sp.]